MAGIRPKIPQNSQNMTKNHRKWAIFWFRMAGIAGMTGTLSRLWPQPMFTHLFLTMTHFGQNCRRLYVKVCPTPWFFISSFWFLMKYDFSAHFHLITFFVSSLESPFFERFWNLFLSIFFSKIRKNYCKPCFDKAHDFWQIKSKFFLSMTKISS